MYDKNHKNVVEAIRQISDYKSNDKSGLFYMLRVVNHKDYFHSYEQNYKRAEILQLLITELQTENGFKKFVTMSSYRHLAI